MESYNDTFLILSCKLSFVGYIKTSCRKASVTRKIALDVSFKTTTGICYVELYQIPTFQVKRALYPTHMQFFENVLKIKSKKCHNP